MTGTAGYPLRWPIKVPRGGAGKTCWPSGPCAVPHRQDPRSTPHDVLPERRGARNSQEGAHHPSPRLPPRPEPEMSRPGVAATLAWPSTRTEADDMHRELREPQTWCRAYGHPAAVWPPSRRWTRACPRCWPLSSSRAARRSSDRPRADKMARTAAPSQPIPQRLCRSRSSTSRTRRTLGLPSGALLRHRSHAARAPVASSSAVMTEEPAGVTFLAGTRREGRVGVRSVSRRYANACAAARPDGSLFRYNSSLRTDIPLIRKKRDERRIAHHPLRPYKSFGHQPHRVHPAASGRHGHLDAINQLSVLHSNR